MPTSRPRHMVTESDRLSQAIDAAAEISPELAGQRGSADRSLAGRVARRVARRMAGPVVLDAGALVALWDSRDTHHRWALDFFHRTLGDEWVMSALTYAELMVHPDRAGKQDQALASMSGLNLSVRGIEGPDGRDLASLRARTGLKMRDAVVLQLALDTSATLATTDRTLARAGREECVQVVSP